MSLPIGYWDQYLIAQLSIQTSKFPSSVLMSNYPVQLTNTTPKGHLEQNTTGKLVLPASSHHAKLTNFLQTKAFTKNIPTFLHFSLPDSAGIDLESTKCIWLGRFTARDQSAFVPHKYANKTHRPLSTVWIIC